MHQGDGTATIAHGDSSLFTFSMHCASNFPLRKARSDLDIPLEDGAASLSPVSRCAFTHVGVWHGQA